MTHKIREGIEEFAKELSEKVRYYAGKGQYPNDQVIQKAYLDGVETAIGMMYIDLTGTPKSEGMLAKFLHQELQKARAEMLHKLHLCAIGKYEGDALENVKAQIKEYQSELDQDK